MSETQSEIEALNAEEAKVLERLRGIYDEARKILGDDLPRFVEREVKRHFVAAPEFADSLSDAQVTALKEAIASDSGAAAERIMSELEDDAPWIAGVDTEKETPRSFADNASLWAVVDQISKVALTLLTAHAFPVPEGGFDVHYRQPTWFIAGKHIGTVSEHYWRGIRELQGLRARRQELASGRKAEDLKRRWESI